MEDVVVFSPVRRSAQVRMLVETTLHRRPFTRVVRQVITSVPLPPRPFTD